MDLELGGLGDRAKRIKALRERRAEIDEELQHLEVSQSDNFDDWKSRLNKELGDQGIDEEL